MANEKSFRVVVAGNGYVVCFRTGMFSEETKLVAADKKAALKIIEGLI